MKATRILGALCATVLLSSLSTLAACGGEPESKEAQTSKTVSAASVTISLMNEAGVKVGEGSGVLIAPRLVLTSAHLISGKTKWVVKSADGKQSAEGSRGLTYDWRNYESSLAHPRLHDVGIIHLDASIKLDAYPRVVTEKSGDGTKATRIRGTGAGFEQIGSTLGKVRTSPNAYLVDTGAETLDTGGAVFDARGILGIVQGRGTTTGKLYIARTDRLAQWLSPKVICAGGAMGVRTFASPAPKEEVCEDGGAGASSSSSSGAAAGGNGGDGNTATDGTPSDSCSGDNDGLCSGAGCTPGNAALNPNASPNGNNNGESGAGSQGGGAGGSAGTPGSAGTDGNAGTPGQSGNNGTPGESGAGSQGGGAGGNAGAPGAAGSDSNSAGNNNNANNGGNEKAGANKSGGAGGSSSKSATTDEGEGCQGADDNQDLCPSEADGCVGPSCGGGYPDNSVEYGACACSGSSGSSGGIYLR